MTVAVLFSFPFPGPWGRELTDHTRELAWDIAREPGLMWKIWLEDQPGGRAGGIYLFEDAASALAYRDMHVDRLKAQGLAGISAEVFTVNTPLSVITRALTALDERAARRHPSEVLVDIR